MALKGDIYYITRDIRLKLKPWSSYREKQKKAVKSGYSIEIIAPVSPYDLKHYLSDTTSSYPNLLKTKIFKTKAEARKYMVYWVKKNRKKLAFMIGDLRLAKK